MFILGARRRSKFVTTRWIGLAFVVLVLFNILGVKYAYRRFDWTKPQLYSLSSKTHHLLKKVDSPLKAFLFFDGTNFMLPKIQRLLKDQYMKSPKYLNPSTDDNE